MNLPINHLIKTLDRCCGQWEFVNEPCNTALMRTYVVRFFNTGMVYSVAFLDGHWTTASAWLQNRLNGKTRDDAGELQRIVSVEVVDGWNVWRNPPPDFVIQSGDEYNWGIFEPDRWKPFVAAVGGPLKRFADTSAYPFSIRRRIAQPSLPSDFDCVPEPMEAPFRAGDWVVCVDDSASSGITVGSVYLVLGLDESGDPELTCDDGYRSYYLALRFRRARPDEIPQTVNQIPCGGCGAKTSKERCIGCFHNFGDEPQPATPRTPADAPPTLQQSNAEICRQNGWTVGTVLEGDEGLGPEQIEITAIGKDCVLACRETDEYESLWSLKYRQWKVVSPPALQLREGAWYRTEQGEVFGPMAVYDKSCNQWHVEANGELLWRGSGKEICPDEKPPRDLIREVPPPVASPFDVGDRVKCIKEGSTILNVGCVYTVRDYSTNGIRVLDGVADWLPFDCFELVPPVEPAVKECLTPERRTDTEGRDVTDLPGLWDESDTVEPEQPEPFNAGDWVVAICWTGDFNAGSVHQIHDIAFRRATPAEVEQYKAGDVNNGCDDLTVDRSQPTAQPDADGWIKWSGVKCPVDREHLVRIRFRDGEETTYSHHAGTLRWDHNGSSGDIVAYRLVQPAPKYRPFASAPDGGRSIDSSR